MHNTTPPFIRTKPNNYHVQRNRCYYHPETCVSNDWVVIAPDGSKHSTYFHEVTAVEVVDALNLKYMTS